SSDGRRMMTSVGVISHLPNVGFDEVRALAKAAEDAGADWLGLPDAFWWRDTWLLLGEAAHATERIELGPMVTNPYLRHPFHTVAAVATLQDVAGQRGVLGFGGGGRGGWGEVSGCFSNGRRAARRSAGRRPFGGAMRLSECGLWQNCSAMSPMGSR